MPPQRTSRYRFTSAYTDSAGHLYLSEREHFGYRERTDNIQHVVSDGDTWMSIAALYYPLTDAAQYWWAVAEYQPTGPVVDPTLRLPPGSVVVAPSAKLLSEQILNERRRQTEDHG